MYGERRQCEFFLLRYVPDAVKDEFVNLGVVLYEPGEAGSGQAAFADVRFTRDWRRVRCLDPDADVEMLEALEREIRERLAEGGDSREWLLKQDGGFASRTHSADAGQGGAGGVAAGGDGEPGGAVPGAGAARRSAAASGRQMVFGRHARANSSGRGYGSSCARDRGRPNTRIAAIR